MWQHCWHVTHQTSSSPLAYWLWLLVFSGLYCRNLAEKAVITFLLTCHTHTRHLQSLTVTHLSHLPRLPPLVNILQEPPGGCLLLCTELRLPWPRGAGHWGADGRVRPRLCHGHHWSRCDHLSDPSPSSLLTPCSSQNEGWFCFQRED